MPSLIALLPPRSVAIEASSELAYAVVSDAGMMTQHGVAPLGLLPKSNDCILQLPLSELSWICIDLPKPGRALPAAKLRTVLENLIEDQVLGEVSQLHIALPAEAPGGKTWVAVCDHAWLKHWIRHFESNNRPIARIIPQSEPQTHARWHISGSPENPRLIASNADAVMDLPLALWRLAQTDSDQYPETITAEPVLAATAEHALQKPVQITQSAQHLASQISSTWNIGQFDLVTSGSGKWLQKLMRSGRNALFGQEWQWARWAAVVLMLAHLLGINIWAWTENLALQRKRAALQKTVQSVSGNTYISSEPELQLRKQLDRMRQETGSLSAQDFEPMLGAIAAVLPLKHTGVTMNFTEQELRIQGLQLDADGLQKARTALATQSYRLRSQDGILIIGMQAAPTL